MNKHINKQRKKVLIIANTYFQLITAINLRYTYWKDDIVDIILTDNSVNAQHVVENLNKNNIFNKAFFIKAEGGSSFYKKSRLARFKTFLKKYSYWKNVIDYKEYEYLMFFNVEIFSLFVFNNMKKDAICYRYEEGFVSYLRRAANIKNKTLTKLFYSIIFRKNIINSIKKSFFYNPDLICFKPNYTIEKIKNLDRTDKELSNALNCVFDYDASKDKYSQKYIFFEECFYCDGKDVDDLDLILKIADIVGKENLLVKLHPRNKVDRFKKYGIPTNKTVGIPWEVIQMNNDFSEKVLLTISSGSVLASKLYFNDNIKTYLLFNCTEKMSDMVTDEYFEYLKKVENKFGLDNFVIPNNKEEFFRKLENEKD